MARGIKIFYFYYDLFGAVALYL